MHHGEVGDWPQREDFAPTTNSQSSPLHTKQKRKEKEERARLRGIRSVPPTRDVKARPAALSTRKSLDQQDGQAACLKANTLHRSARAKSATSCGPYTLGAETERGRGNRPTLGWSYWQWPPRSRRTRPASPLDLRSPDTSQPSHGHTRRSRRTPCRRPRTPNSPARHSSWWWPGRCSTQVASRAGEGRMQIRQCHRATALGSLAKHA